MEYLLKIWDNKLLICAAAAWLFAQVLKVILVLIFEKKLNFERLIGSGGMPSSHSAFVTALCTASAVRYGLSGAEFAITFVLAFIVMYDAAGIRRAAGEQAKIINLLTQNMKHEDAPQIRVLKELLGHTLPEVVAGAALGVAVSLLILL